MECWARKGIATRIADTETAELRRALGPGALILYGQRRAEALRRSVG